MIKMTRQLLIPLGLLLLGLAAIFIASQSYAQPKQAGHDHDYRTFHQNGQIDYGVISDSYRPSW